MKETLRTINKINGVRGCAIIGSDGLVIAADMADSADVSPLGALASEIANILGQTLARLDRGNFQRLVLTGSDGRMVLMAAGSDALLAALLRKDAPMGMVLVELKEAAKGLHQHLGL
mgnify:CR=1 FL=1